MTWTIDILLSLTVPALALLGMPVVLQFERRCSSVGPELRWAAAFALGLAYLQVGGMVLAWSGSLTRGAAAAWVGAGVVCASGWLWHQRRVASAPHGRPARGQWQWLWLAAPVALLLLLASVPPWYRDELVYHLALPRLFASTGGFTAQDESFFAFLPLGWESILALLATFGEAPDFFPPFNPRLAGVWTSVGVALSAVGLTRLLGVPARRAKFAGVLLLLVPTFVEFGSSAYVEPYLLLLSVLALAAVLRVRNDARFALPAGVFAGLAASVKYPGLAVGALLCLTLLLEALRRSRAKERDAAALATLRLAFVATVVGAPFYIHNLLEKGNPIFPLAWELFGGSGWDAWRAQALSYFLDQYGEGRGAVDFLLLPFRLFTTRELDQGFEGVLGPVVGIGFLAGILCASRGGALPRRRSAALLVFAVAWTLFWAGTTQQTRFYLVAVPPLLALLGAGLERGLRRHRKFRPLSVVGVLALSVGWALGPLETLWTRQGTTDWLTARVSKDELLSTLLPSSYPVYQDLEQLVPPDGRVWLVWMRSYTYYLRRPYRLDSIFEAYRLEALLDESRDASEAWQALRAAASHLLVNHEFFLVDGNADLEPGRTERLQRRFDDLVRRGALQVVQRWNSTSLYAVSATAPGGTAAPPEGRAADVWAR